MNCKKCHNEVGGDSKFCEFCGEKVGNETKKHIKENGALKSEKDLKNLRSKPWYRFLKVLYVAGFTFSMLYVLAYAVDTSLKVVKSGDVMINCADFRVMRERIYNPKRTSQYDYNYKVSDHNEIVEACKGEEFYMNIDVGATLKYLLACFFVILTFEFSRQIVYYIFLGRLYHTWLTSKLFRIWH